MKSKLHTVGVLIAVLIITGCSHTLKKPAWTFEKDAVHMHLKADNKLNLYNNKAHTLYVCFYQLKELTGFEELAKDVTGIQQLLDCRLFDESVASADSKVIHAGEDILLTLDRADRALYMAFVAGYSTMLTDERVVRSHKFQVSKSTKGIFKKVDTCRPCELTVEVSFGAKQVEYSKIITTNEVMCSDECE